MLRMLASALLLIGALAEMTTAQAVQFPVEEKKISESKAKVDVGKKKVDGKKGGDDKKQPDDGLTDAQRALAKAAKAGSVNDRVAAIKEIAGKGTDANPLARILCSCALDKNADVRDAALDALEKVAPEIAKDVATIILDKDENERAGAAITIVDRSKVNSASPVLLALIEERLKGRPDISGAGFAAYFFSWLAENDDQDPDTFKALFAHTRSNNALVRGAAIDAVVLIGAKSASFRPEAVKAVVAGLSDKDFGVQLASAEGAGKLGKHARSALPGLQKLKRTSTPRTITSLGNPPLHWPAKDIRDLAAEMIKTIEADVAK